MKKTTLSSVRVVVFVWVVCQLRMVVEGGLARVTITNGLGTQLVLGVRCWSGDDGLGKHELRAGGVYGFAFTPHVWGNTMFWCSFESEAYGTRTIRVWQGWLWLSRRTACWNCYWVVTPTGFKCNDEYLYSWRPW